MTLALINNAKRSGFRNWRAETISSPVFLNQYSFSSWSTSKRTREFFCLRWLLRIRSIEFIHRDISIFSCHLYYIYIYISKKYFKNTLNVTSFNSCYSFTSILYLVIIIFASQENKITKEERNGIKIETKYHYYLKESLANWRIAKRLKIRFAIFDLVSRAIIPDNGMVSISIVATELSSGIVWAFRSVGLVFHWSAWP